MMLLNLVKNSNRVVYCSLHWPDKINESNDEELKQMLLQSQITALNKNRNNLGWGASWDEKLAKYEDENIENENNYNLNKNKNKNKNKKSSKPSKRGRSLKKSNTEIEPNDNDEYKNNNDDNDENYSQHGKIYDQNEKKQFGNRRNNNNDNIFKHGNKRSHQENDEQEDDSTQSYSKKLLKTDHKDTMKVDDSNDDKNKNNVNILNTPPSMPAVAVQPNLTSSAPKAKRTSFFDKLNSKSSRIEEKNY